MTTLGVAGAGWPAVPPPDPEPPPFLAPRPIDLPTPVPLDPGADLSVLDEAKILAGPDALEDVPRWRAQLERWRHEARQRIAFDDALYRRPDLAWTGGCFSVALVWLWDELLYDRATRRFTPDRLLDDGRDRFGGYDGLVLWHAYPVIGIDERNQFDHYRDVPGIRELVRAVRDRGVRVFLDYNPWDTGTRREPVDDATALARLVTDLDADGLFLDTMKQGAGELRSLLDAARQGVALEGESRVPLARIHDHPLSWAQWFADSRVPGVLRARWFERRHLLHHTRRWHRDHGEELRSAWLNGSGMLVWEVVFGSWVGWSDRDRAALRAMLVVQRAYRRHLEAGTWTPLADATAQAWAAGVHASRFELDGRALWLVANTRSTAFDGPVLDAQDRPGARWFELLSGMELPAGRGPGGQGSAARGLVWLRLPAGGLAAVLATPHVDATLTSVLRARAVADDPVDGSFRARPTARVHGPTDAWPAAALRAAARDGGGTSPDLVEVEGFAGGLTVTSRLRETGLGGEAPFVDEWKPLPPRLHRRMHDVRQATLAPFRIAAAPVTVGDFRGFLAATGGDPAVVTGQPGDPVTGVSLDQARAHAGWAGARLPTELEWQVAAESGTFADPDPPRWEWTESEHTDGRTRWSLLKGGPDGGITGSEWYLEGGPRAPTETLKLLHQEPGRMHSPWITFRLAADAVRARGGGGGAGAGAAVAAGVTIEAVPSSVLGEPIRCLVRRPPPGAPGAATGLPVLLLLHGRGGSMLDWMPLLARLDASSGAGAVPLLVLAPDATWSDRASWYVDSGFTGTPLGRPVASALVTDLVPAIVARFGGSHDRLDWTLAGVSMGGAGALGLALRHPERFGAAMCLSPAIHHDLPPDASTSRVSGAFGDADRPFDPRRYRAEAWPAHLGTDRRALPLTILLSSGDREQPDALPTDGSTDPVQEAARLVAALKAVPGIQVRWRVMHGDHGWNTWLPALEADLAVLHGRRGRVITP